MPNNIVLHKDGWIEQSYEGNQTDVTLTESVRQSVELIERLRQEGKPVCIVVNIVGLGKLTTSARKVAVTALTKIKYDKIAIYGANTFTKALVSLIVHASGKIHTVKVFNKRSEALAWIGQHAEQQIKTY